MKSMKRRINFQFVIIALIAILMTLLLTVAAFYEVFKQEIFTDLRTYTSVLKSTGVFDEPGNYKYVPDTDELRITIINSDGSVAYDTSADIQDMDNHGNRPEVEEAFLGGKGEAVRLSATMDKSTFYYAALLSDGCVLRIAKEAGSVWSIIYRALPMIVIIVMLLALASMVLAHFLTRSLVEPIERMAGEMDHLESVHVYRELIPFVNTIQKQHEDILKSAIMRQEFTANVSHELKTPLTSISGYSELIENGMATDTDVVRFAGEIHKNSNRLLTLINDTIRLSELDVTDSRSTFENTDVYAVAENCINMLLVSAENHGVTLTLEGESHQALGNREMMEELIYNLTDNAIRYNNNGGLVMVGVREEEGQVVLMVKDTGIGIPKEHQNRVFERFYRVDKSRSKSTGGTGLGLAIVKHIVAQLDADLDLKSEVGKGTEIKVKFRH